MVIGFDFFPFERRGIIGGFGLLAINQSNTLKDVCPGGGCSPAREKELEALDTLALTTDILLGAGVAVAATGVVLLVWPEREESETEIAMVPLPGGVAVDIRF